MGFRLVERDYRVMNEVSRWRFCLGRHIRILAGFPGRRSCDRRLTVMVKADYLTREHYIYGIPSLYMVTQKAKEIFNLQYFTSSIRIENIQHDIAVIETAIYLSHHGVDYNTIITERELKHQAGFGNPKHYPDFVYSQNNSTYCVEVELSLKKQATLESNIKSNYLKYDNQKWFIPVDKVKITEHVIQAEKKYPNIEIIPLDVVKEYVKTLWKE